MEETPRQPPPPLQEGTLSADGSRRWNGQFWVLQRANPATAPPPAPVRRAPPGEPLARRRSARPGGVVVAASVGVLLSHLHFTLPMYGGPLESALSALVLVNELWFLFTYGSVVVILSLGRQGIDLLLLRAAVVGFVLGASFVGVTPLVIVPVPLWLLAVVVSALISAVVGGLVLGLLATLANLLWYRSLASLRPQLRVFNRGS